MEVKMNRASFLCENRSGHYNLNLKTWRHVTGHNEQHTPLKIGCELGCYIKVSSSSDTRVSHSSFRSPLHLDVSVHLYFHSFCRGLIMFYSYYLSWFPYQPMSVSFTSNKMGDTTRAGTASFQGTQVHP
jgi:hypothetical protein